MSVVLGSIVFHNGSGLAMRLSIEAPKGTPVYGPKPVDPGSTIKISPQSNNCQSARIIADNPDEPGHDAKQEFIIAPSTGRYSYLGSIEVTFSPGDITGWARISTEHS
jgi:hypothetical protein